MHVVRGDHPTQLDGAKVYLVVSGAIDAAPRWTLATGETTEDRLVPPAPVSSVTGVKIVSAHVSPAAGQDTSDDALELREVKVWATAPATGAGPLTDLTATAHADGTPSGSTWPASDQTPGSVIDADDSSSAEPPTSTIVFGATEDIRRIDFYERSTYPGTFFYSPPSTSCPAEPLCGNSYGGCSYRNYGASVYALDGNGAHTGAALETLGADYLESFSPTSSTLSTGLAIEKPSIVNVDTAACPSGYQTEAFLDLSDIRIFGYASTGPRLMNYALASRGATFSASPPAATGGAEDYAPERAGNGWFTDYAMTGGTGAQVFMVTLERPVLAEAIRVVTPDPTTVAGATLEILVDGGVWQSVATLSPEFDVQVSLPGDQLVAAARLRTTGTALAVSELEVLATPRY